MSKREALQRIGDRVTLPACPEVVARIGAMLDDPTVGVREVGAVVAEDPALTVAVLRIANSAQYGLSEPVLSAEGAASVVGVRSMKNLALQASLMKRYEGLSGGDSGLQELWAHSLFTARLARAIALLAGDVAGLSPEEFYTCGLLHDVGKALLIDGLGDEYLELFRQARRAGKALHVVEAEQLGFTHTEVGALLALRWELPEALATAIEHHHGPREMILATPAVAVVSIADQLAYRARSRTFEATGRRLAALAERVLGLAPERFEQVLELARKRAETAPAW